MPTGAQQITPGILTLDRSVAEGKNDIVGGDRLPRDKHGMPQRHTATVERLLVEETG